LFDSCPYSCERNGILVISFHQLMTGVVMGLILVIIGFAPGLLDKWAEALSDFAETILYRAPLSSRARSDVGPQRWIGAMGMALIALSLFLYTSH
jgi:hypothetical protein